MRGLEGNDVVTLPNKAAWIVKNGYYFYTDGSRYFDAGAGADRVTGGNLDDVISGGSTNESDTIRGGLGNDILFGGPGWDVISGDGGTDYLLLTGNSTDYDLGGKRPFYFDHAEIYDTTTNDLDFVDGVERYYFDDRKLVITEWARSTALSSIPSLNRWNHQKMSTPGTAFLSLVLGTPTLEWSGDTIVSVAAPSHRVAEPGALIVQQLTDNYKYSSVKVGGIKVQGLKEAVHNLIDIIKDAADIADLPKAEVSNLLNNITTAGMFNARLVDKTQSISAHSWGTAIDLKVDGILDYTADKKVHLALAKLIPVFNEHGWIAGAGFGKGREDDMHFEMSKELLQKVFNYHQGSFAGSGKSEVFDGTDNDDRMIGHGGGDTFRPGLGREVLQGGAGKDYFIFDTPTAADNVDKVSQLTVKDEVDLAASAFDGIGHQGTALDEAFFVRGTVATEAEQRIIYDPESGDLFYDSDGVGTDDTAELIAVLPNNLELHAQNFFVV